MNKNLADILILSDQFELRGSCLQTLSLATDLPKKQIGVQIVSQDASQIHPDQKKTLHMLVNPYLKYRLLDPITMEFIAFDLAETLPDLIHIQTSKMHLLGKKLARRLKIPYVLSLHNHMKPGESLYMDSQYGMGVICISKSVQESLLSTKTVSEDRTTVISSGVKLYAGTSTKRLSSGGVVVVGTAGPFEKNKGLNYFVQAASIILKERKQIQFLIAGAGPEEKALRQLTKELKIQTSFTFVPDDFDLDKTLQAVDIFCLPSLEQGLGTIMLHAMAHGIPVIASRIGGVNSVIADGTNGLLVPPGNSEEIAQSVIRLLEDPDLANRLMKTGLDFVEAEYSLEIMLKKHQEYYLKSIETFRTQSCSK